MTATPKLAAGAREDPQVCRAGGLKLAPSRGTSQGEGRVASGGTAGDLLKPPLGLSHRDGRAGVRRDSRPAAGADLTSSLTARSQKKGGRSRGARGADRILIVATPRGSVRDLRLTPELVSIGGGTSPAVTGGTFPKPGSIPWSRAFYGDHVKRGALVDVNGRPAHLLSARGGLLFVRDWRSGRRIAARPSEISAPTS